MMQRPLGSQFSVHPAKKVPVFAGSFFSSRGSLGAYGAKGAAKACGTFADLELAWFEEPVLSDDIEGHAKLKGSPVKIGAGESWFVDDFSLPIQQKVVGVIEPSVSRCEGTGVQIDVARKAANLGIPFSPMVGMNSVLSLAASIHAASACPSVGVGTTHFPTHCRQNSGKS